MATKNEKITTLLNEKQIQDPLVREVTTTFITKHDELYGDIIPFDSLLTRLSTNLNEIKIIDPNSMPTEHNFKDTVGQYQGFNENTIKLYFSKESLHNPQLKIDFCDILTHELTHCAYTRKENDLYETETQIFCSMNERLDGKTSITKGNDTYMEPIINYISSRITGRKNSAYVAQTANITKLTNLVNEKEIVGSAFYSDEIRFKKAFESLPNRSYEYFTSGMEWFKIGRYDRGNDIMNNFFQGKISGLTPRQTQIEELHTAKKKLQDLKPLIPQKTIPLSYQKTLQKKGAINIFLLTLILEIFSVLLIAFLSIIN